MFYITISPQRTVISGIKALEQTRILKIGESTNICWSDNSNILGSHKPTCKVDEAFARAWFGEEQIRDCVDIPLKLLVPGDVRYCNESNNYSITFADISDERAKELYIAARIMEILPGK